MTYALRPSAFLLVLQRLPQGGVKGPLGDVAVDVDGGIGAALPDDAPGPLLQVVEGDEPVLDVHTRAHLEGAPDEHPYLAGADLGEKLLLSFKKTPEN